VRTLHIEALGSDENEHRYRRPVDAAGDAQLPGADEAGHGGGGIAVADSDSESNLHTQTAGEDPVARRFDAFAHGTSGRIGGCDW